MGLIAITREKFEEIMDFTELEFDGDNAFDGLVLIKKYMPTDDVICGADHDIIYSVDIDQLIKAGITEEDVIKLAKLNWMIRDDYMACFV